MTASHGDSLLERVAAAIHAADEVGNYPHQFAWADDTEQNREDYRTLARAALGVVVAELRDLADDVDACCEPVVTGRADAISEEIR